MFIKKSYAFIGLKSLIALTFLIFLVFTSLKTQQKQVSLASHFNSSIKYKQQTVSQDQDSDYSKYDFQLSENENEEEEQEHLNDLKQKSLCFSRFSNFSIPTHYISSSLSAPGLSSLPKKQFQGLSLSISFRKLRI